MARQPIPISEKIALRERRRQHPLASTKQLAQWFLETFNRSLSQSTISEITSSRYLHLDNKVTKHQTKSKRLRSAKWPDLEAALLHWIQLAESQIPISQEVILEKARFFWSQLPLYQGLPMPTFSNGWLQGFQSRSSIHVYKRHGEEGSVQESSEEQMKLVREVLQQYRLKDIFNCDETSLFWKRVPDRSLATQSLPGVKKEKARISVLFCCNSDGSEKIKPLFIGTAKKPRAFTSARINIENLNLFWKSNKKAWMTGEIFEEWLRWFDSSMVGRKVVLLMDNFSAHEAAVKTIRDSLSPLQNTFILWLPPHSTSRFQPLDQGIINTWKTYWKGQWVRYMLSNFDQGINPVASMDVLKAIKWGTKAWELDLSATTISNCFNKAIADHVANATSRELQPILDKVTADLQALKTYIPDQIDLDEFIEPKDEVILDDMDNIDDIVLSVFESEKEEEEDGEPAGVEPIPRILESEALQALQKVMQYEEQQEKGNTRMISELNRYEREIEGRKLAKQTQRDIRSFFG